MSDKNLSKSTPIPLKSKLLRDDPAALRRTLVLPKFALEGEDFVEHASHLAWKCLRMNDIEGYVDVHVANRLRLLRSAGKKVTDRDEKEVYAQVLDDLRIMDSIKTSLLEHALHDIDE